MVIEFNEELKEKIIVALRDRGAKLRCPRCGGVEFGVVDGFHMTVLSRESDDIAIEGRTLVNAVVICTKCGYIAEHSMVGLGLVPPSETKA
jgi:predicted RNA-binding Zn-ribbon protein involved in translation (DUF1610 family)